MQPSAHLHYCRGVPSLTQVPSPLLPAVHTAREYSVRKFRRDIIAGLTVSVVELPQAIAYAIIAGVPPQYGIYSSMIQGVLGAMLSSSEHLTTGPTNTQSLLIAATAIAATRGAQVDDPGAFYLLIVFTLTVMKGLIQLSFWALRFGDLVQFISRSVILGIATGAAVLIVSGQAASFLGIGRDPADNFRFLSGVPLDLARMWHHFGEIRLAPILIGLFCVGLIVGGRMISKFLPGALIAVVLSAAAVPLLGLNIRTVGALDAQLPHFTLPLFDWGVWTQLFTGALALALLGGIESIAIAKTIAARSGEKIIANQEFFAQGLKNAITGFFQCIPGSASFTRSALDYDAGAETRFAAVMNAIFVGVLFFLLADYAKFIPNAALAGVLFVVAYGLFEFRHFFRLMKADRSDSAVFAVTFLATILLPLQYAVFIGIFLNIAFYLRTSAKLHIAEMIATDTGGFMERPVYDKASGERRVIFIQLEGELFFAIADQLRDQLAGMMRSGVRVVVMRLKRCHSIDGTVLDVLENFVRDMKQRDRHVLLCGVRPEVMRTLRSYGLLEQIGKDNVFAAEQGVFTSARRALQRARTLVGVSIDTSDINLDEEITYEI